MEKQESPLSEELETNPYENLWPVAWPAWWRTFLFRVLTGRQITVFLYLLTCIDGKGECDPTTDEIRSFVGLNRPAMIFDALEALDRYGFIVRHRRMLPSTGGRRNLYRRPPFEYTILKLLENNVLDERLRVRHDEASYTPEVMQELDAAVREILTSGYDVYINAPDSERRELMMFALAEQVRRKTVAVPLTASPLRSA